MPGDHPKVGLIVSTQAIAERLAQLPTQKEMWRAVLLGTTTGIRASTFGEARSPQTLSISVGSILRTVVRKSGNGQFRRRAGNDRSKESAAFDHVDLPVVGQNLNWQSFSNRAALPMTRSSHAAGRAVWPRSGQPCGGGALNRSSDRHWPFHLTRHRGS